MAVNPTRDEEKKVDMPPRGDRNPDPLTNEAGSHPVETGVGAAVAGAASGLAVGAVTGPVGAAIGAAAGAIVGGLAGKGVGEMIDPTTDDTWLRDNFTTRPYVRQGETFESYVPAYRYGAEAESRYSGRSFDELESEISGDWGKLKEHGNRSWQDARGAVRDAYERSCQIRSSRAGTKTT
jgi:hypothetical protein